MSKLTTIKIEDVPEFLKSSDRCTHIDVPEQYFMKTVKVESLEDCVKILNILDYWGAKHVPSQFWDYLVDNPDVQKEVIEVLRWSTTEIAKRILESLEIITSCEGPYLIKVALDKFDKFTIEYLFDHDIYVPINELILSGSKGSLMKIPENHEWIEQLQLRYNSNPVFTPEHNKWDTSETNKILIYDSIKTGNFEMIKKIVSGGFNVTDYQIISYAAHYKNFEIFEYLYDNWKHNSDKYYHQYIISSVLQSQSQSLEMLKYVFEKRDYGIGCIDHHHFHYIKSIEIFKYLVTQGLKIRTFSGLERLSYDLLDYIFDVNQKESGITIEQPSFITTQIIDNISLMEDYVERLKYFVSKGFKLISTVSIDEVKADTEEQELVKSFNKQHRTSPITRAISRHKIPLIEYLLSQGLEYPDCDVLCIYRY